MIEALLQLEGQWYRPLAILLLALLVDLVVGEYPSFIHPVVWIGTVIGLLRRIAPMRGSAVPFLYGLGMAVVVPSLFALGAVALLQPLRGLGLLVAEVLLLKSTFAVRALGRAAYEMHSALKRQDLDAARLGLRSLCSRESHRLTSEGLSAATVESIAENTSDSFVAPILFFALFGIPGAVFYRAVNTLDSMIGYHGKYEYLGKASARFDDLLNLVPARITAVMFLVAGVFVGADVGNGARILIRDGGATASPNAGRPMAAMAGLLNVLLAKEGAYSLGDAKHPVTPRYIRRAFVISAVAVVASVGALAGALGTLHVLFEG